MQCVILAGGRGTRLGHRTEDVPKALVDVAGRPFLDYQLELLRAGGVKEVVLCVGYLGSLVEERSGTARSLATSGTPRRPGALGTAGALRNALPLLGESFLVTYGDTLLSVDYPAVADAHASSWLPALMTVLGNENASASNAVVEDGLVVAYGKARLRKARAGSTTDCSPSIGRDRAAPRGSRGRSCGARRRRQLAAFEVEGRFYEIGDEAALAETTEFVRASPRFARLRPADTA